MSLPKCRKGRPVFFAGDELLIGLSARKGQNVLRLSGGEETVNKHEIITA